MFGFRRRGILADAVGLFPSSGSSERFGGRGRQERARESGQIAIGGLGFRVLG